MKSILRFGARGLLVAALASQLVACAMEKRAAAPEAAGAAAPQQPQQPQGYAPGAYPSTTPSMPAATTPSSPPPPPPAAPGGPYPQGGSSRSMAVQNAANEVDTSQRELEVADGDCRNACRALGSMDRAAGRLCGLTQGDPETRRCDDAKSRVYSARDRVKATCGQCEGGPSVERSAPIPSRP